MCVAVLKSASGIRLGTMSGAGERHWSIFLRLCQETPATDNLVADAYFAELAIEHGCEWISTDHNFARFPGLKESHPLG